MNNRNRRIQIGDIIRDSDTEETWYLQSFSPYARCQYTWRKLYSPDIKDRPAVERFDISNGPNIEYLGNVAFGAMMQERGTISGYAALDLLKQQKAEMDPNLTYHKGTPSYYEHTDGTKYPITEVPGNTYHGDIVINPDGTITYNEGGFLLKNYTYDQVMELAGKNNA